MLSSSQSQLLSAEAEIVRSGDHAGPVCSSEKGIVITPAWRPQPFSCAPHSLRTSASTIQGL